MIARAYLWFPGLVKAGLATFLLIAFAGITRAEDIKVEARLIWATNDQTSPDPNHKPVDPELAKWLGHRYTWKHYFKVERKVALIPEGVTNKFVMSDKCIVEVKNIGKNGIFANLIGEGKSFCKVTQALPPGESLGLAGDSRNDTAWFVILKNTAEVPPKPATGVSTNKP